MAPVFGYWDIRGRAEPIRCLLHYTGTEYQDKRYVIGQQEWLNSKEKLGLEFPNLPYFIDGDLKMTQSMAILKHVARQHGLVPEVKEKDLCRAEIAEQQIMDLYAAFFRLVYNERFASEKQVYVRGLPDKMAAFSKFLGTRSWLMGQKLTYLDFFLHDVLDVHRFLVPGCLEAFDNLREYFDRFEALPQVVEYRKSKEFKKWPVCGPTAFFGGSGEPPEQ